MPRITITNVISNGHVNPTFTVVGTLDLTSFAKGVTITCAMSGPNSVSSGPPTHTSTTWQADFTGVPPGFPYTLTATLTSPSGGTPAVVSDLTVDAGSGQPINDPIIPGGGGGGLAVKAAPTLIKKRFTQVGQLRTNAVRHVSCAFFVKGQQVTEIFEAVIDYDFGEYVFRIDLSKAVGETGSMVYFVELWPAGSHLVAIPNLKVEK